jgi:hypothetical protein
MSISRLLRLVLGGILTLALVGQLIQDEAIAQQSHIPGPRGPIGPQGVGGSPGLREPAGSANWYSGSGRPASDIGADGDLYFRTDTVQIYCKSAGVWSVVTTFGPVAISRNASDLGFLQQGTGAVARTVQDKLRETISATDFGAKCDGATDDTPALQKWLDRAAPFAKLVLPAGYCLFSAPLTVASSSSIPGLTISGDGPYSSVLAYVGASTTVDLFTVGNNSNYQVGWMLQNFRVTSGTTMTAGTGIHLRRVLRSSIYNVIPDGQDGSHKLWNGIWFDGIDIVNYTGFIAMAQNDAIRVSGEAGDGGAKADLLIQQGKVMSSAAGIHVGGAFGGLLVDQVDVAGNYNNLLVDTSLTAEGNRELTFGSGAAFDVTAGGEDILVTDTLSNPGYMNFTGSWIASSSADGLRLVAGTKWNVVISGGTIFNHRRDGIRNESSDAVITVDGARVWANGLGGSGYGINSTVASPHIQIGSGASWANNTSGDLAPSVLSSTLPIHYSAPDGSTDLRAKGDIALHPFGVRCNGSTDDTGAINAALAAGKAVELPAGTCNVAGTLSISVDNASLIGKGTGSTVVNCIGSGTADCIQVGTFPDPANCVGSTPPANCRQSYRNRIENLTVQAPSRTGGHLFDVNGASLPRIADIEYSGWNLLFAQYVNTLQVVNLTGYSRATAGDYAILLQQPITAGTTAGWYRSDAISIIDTTLNAQSLGVSCVGIDGMVNTIRISRTALLNCARGIYVANSAKSASYYPAFLIADDLEIDGSSDTAVLIAAGSDLSFANSDINSKSCSSCMVFVVQPDSFYSVTRSIRISNSAVHDGPLGLLSLEAKAVTISGSQFYDSSHADSSPVVEIGAAAANISISGSLVGQRYGDPAAPTLGVSVAAGASRIALHGNDYFGATSGSVANNTSNAISFIGGVSNVGAAIASTTCAAKTTC